MKDSVDDPLFHSDQDLKLPQPPLTKAAMTDTAFKLPSDFCALQIEKDFMTIINTRKSSRFYTQMPITLIQLPYLLWITQGVKEIRGKSYATLRTVPSRGARHPFETCLIVKHVEGLRHGKYHYLPMHHELEFLGPVKDFDTTISTSLREQARPIKASVIFYWSFVAYRSEWRYSGHAHRPVLIDIGHVGENLYLGCSALGLGTCSMAAFVGEFCDKLFGLDGKEELTVYTQPVGTISPLDTSKEKAF